MADEEACIAFFLKKLWDDFLLDIGLPGICGVEVSRYLRSIRRHRELRFIARNAHAGPDSEDFFLSAGFDNVLLEPFGSGCVLGCLDGCWQEIA